MSHFSQMMSQLTSQRIRSTKRFRHLSPKFRSSKLLFSCQLTLQSLNFHWKSPLDAYVSASGHVQSCLMLLHGLASKCQDDSQATTTLVAGDVIPSLRRQCLHQLEQCTLDSTGDSSGQLPKYIPTQTSLVHFQAASMSHCLCYPIASLMFLAHQLQVQTQLQMRPYALPHHFFFSGKD